MTATSQGDLITSVKKLDPFVQASDRGLVLDAPQDVLAEIPEEHIAELRTTLSKVQVSAQTAGGQDGEVQLHAAEQRADVTVAATWRGEHGYITQHWYGWEIGMVSYLAGKVSSGAAGASAIAAGVGVAGGGAPAAAISAALTFRSAAVNVCKHENGWSYVYLIGAPPFTPGTVVCNPFG